MTFLNFITLKSYVIYNMFFKII